MWRRIRRCTGRRISAVLLIILFLRLKWEGKGEERDGFVEGMGLKASVGR